MSVTATSPMASALHLLRTILSERPAVQTFLGAANAAAALAKIHLNISRSPTRPYILVGYQMCNISNSGYQHGVFRAQLVRDVPTEHRDNDFDAWTDFANKIGEVASEYAVYSHSQGFLSADTSRAVQIIDVIRSKIGVEGDGEDTDDCYYGTMLIPFGGKTND